MAAGTPVGRTVRALLAVAVACSWLLLAGLPAGAIITDTRVQSPKAGAALKKARPLIVAVDRTAPPAEEKVSVQTRMFYGGTPAPPEEPEPTEQPTEGGDTQEEQAQTQQQPAQLKPVSKKILDLPFIDRKPTDLGDRLRFGGLIEPYNFAWLPNKTTTGTARNGQYTVEYRAVTAKPSDEPWKRFEFRLDAPPPPQGAPGVGVADAAAKSMAVAWRPNAAPDLTGYRVERRLGSGPWRIAQDKIKPDRNYITDTVATFGSYQYRVTAVRPAGDGSKELRTRTSPPSRRFNLQPASQPAPPQGADPGDGGSDAATGDGSTAGDGSDAGSSGDSGGSVPPVSGPPSTTDGFSTQTDDTTQDPGVAPPPGFEDTYKGPLDYNVEQDEVTERVPVDVAQPEGPDDSGTLTVLNRAIDQQRVLPPLAGGLILVVSAAHVLRYLNE